MLTKETILTMLETDKRAVARALVVLNERQTADEQATEITRYQNGMGFRPCHARMGTSMAKQFLQKGFLSDKQISYWRVRDATGAMRIGIYWKQLLDAAAMKKAQVDVVVIAPPMAIAPATAPASTPPAAARDYGNDMERRMVLTEQLGDVLDSDDPKMIDPIANEIDAIDAFWKKLRTQGR